MQFPPDQRFNRIHQAALAAGLQVSRRVLLGEAECYEYDRASGTYVHLAFLDGCFHVPAPFDEVVAKLGSRVCHLPIWPIHHIEIQPTTADGQSAVPAPPPARIPTGFTLSRSRELESV